MNKEFLWTHDKTNNILKTIFFFLNCVLKDSQEKKVDCEYLWIETCLISDNNLKFSLC